ncbi:MAG TPA: maleylpyruvate isomerase family mycothiol-dependent enzyme [Nocardioides sp.]|uniref:maleylpyruvate isomerase family mycothiol-dependent enzyme n=1 Tax=Nocardioides sp. TaxID=35761 RepID=UPI002DA319F1|nr:maleylpyruvate isomerase family mycothiol-dependent enzyme [Marmoricola sp.]
MTNRDHELDVLSRGLDQAAALLDSVGDVDLASATPCHDWTTAELVDHLAASPSKFAQMVRGDEVDWSAPTPHVGDDRADVFRAGSDELRAAWDAVGEGDAPISPDMQSAEFAVHTYDLAMALGRPTTELDAELAERGLAFLQDNLTPDNRGAAFLPEQAAPEGADAYQRIAAFAGRTVTPDS